MIWLLLPVAPVTTLMERRPSPPLFVRFIWLVGERTIPAWWTAATAGTIANVDENTANVAASRSGPIRISQYRQSTLLKLNLG